MPGKLHVLMSTYNGEAYLQPQVESILAQTLPSRLFVRDDGSTDGTAHLLKKLSSNRTIAWSHGRHMGATGSFLRLLGEHANETEYVAFADQDDVWLPSKLERAVEVLSDAGRRRPALYCSRATITNEQLEPIGSTPAWPRQPAFGNALVENIAMGCTIVLNRPAVNLITETPIPKYALFHDWWCYMVVSAFGDVIYDNEPSLLYRQHGNNAVGANISPFGRLVEKVARQFKQDTFGLILAQAEEFAQHYHRRLSPRKAEILAALFAGRDSLVARERLLFDRRIFRQHKHDDALLRLRFAAGLWPAPSMNWPRCDGPADERGGVQLAIMAASANATPSINSSASDL